MSSDFDGDDFDDLVLGAPGESIGTVAAAGAANVIYGSLSGLAAVGNQLWHQNSPGIIDVAELNDRFAGALASGDFNNDGFDDLAVGVRGEDIGTLMDAGAVNVLRGSAAGLAPAGNQLWHLNSAGVVGAPEKGDTFGSALAVGDFDNDDFDDLAVGIRGKDLGSAANAGAVSLLYGSTAGLTGRASQFWHQNSAGVEGAAESDDVFGDALAVGDFDGDDFDDLAVGVRGEDVGGGANAGAVSLLYGSSAGLSAAGDQFWHQDSAGIEGAAEARDSFGDALASGDFNNDGFDDLAIGVRGEDLGKIGSAGAVSVLRGSAAGLTAAGDQVWHQDSAGIVDKAEAGDAFGAALAVGDFNNDGFDDLVIGVPGEDIGAVDDAGAAHVLYGSKTGLAAARSQFWNQDSPGVVSAAEAGDTFGDALTVGDFNNDGFDDLAIGASGEGVGAAAGAGATHILLGSATGLTAAGNKLWYQDSPGILDVSEPGDSLGGWLA